MKPMTRFTQNSQRRKVKQEATTEPKCDSISLMRSSHGMSKFEVFAASRFICCQYQNTLMISLFYLGKIPRGEVKFLIRSAKLELFSKYREQLTHIYSYPSQHSASSFYNQLQEWLNDESMQCKVHRILAQDYGRSKHHINKKIMLLMNINSIIFLSTQKSLHSCCWRFHSRLYFYQYRFKNSLYSLIFYW